jgi:hypothetical protein
VLELLRAAIDAADWARAPLAWRERRAPGLVEVIRR